MRLQFHYLVSIIKYIPLQQGLRRRSRRCTAVKRREIIKYIPLQQGLRLRDEHVQRRSRRIIKYIPLQQGLRPVKRREFTMR